MISLCSIIFHNYYFTTNCCIPLYKLQTALQRQTVKPLADISHSFTSSFLSLSLSLSLSVCLARLLPFPFLPFSSSLVLFFSSRNQFLRFLLHGFGMSSTRVVPRSVFAESSITNTRLATSREIIFPANTISPAPSSAQLRSSRLPYAERRRRVWACPRSRSPAPQ